MRALLRTLVVLSFVVVATGGSALAAQAPAENVKTIAGILAKMNHFASDAEKKTLQGIVASPTATAPEKTLAEALMNVQHTATAADKAKLEALMKDSSAPEAARTIAGIIAGLNHTASAAQKETLTKLAAG
jgi:hypothetical protein